MNKNSNAYIIIYASVMIVIVAILLSVAALALKDRQQANIAVEKQSAILSAIGLGGDADKAKDKTQYIKDEYAKHIVDSYVVNGNGNRVEGDAFELLDGLKAEFAKTDKETMRLPVFQAKLDNGTQLNILAVYGTGLWGPIWGYLALESDWDTIYGAVFAHQGETPGLGAEIATPHFSSQFPGKLIFDNGQLVGIAVLKGVGASAGNDHAVDAISGGTITSRGVEIMLRDCLTAYLPLIERQRAAQVEATPAAETAEVAEAAEAAPVQEANVENE